jgi:hypothetical protein
MLPYVSQINPVHTPKSYFHKIHLIIKPHLRLSIPGRLFLPDFLTKILHALLYSPV